MTCWLSRLYGNLLRLYPGHFRAEFGEEMESVFTEAIRHKSAHQATLQLGRELRDLPGSLIEAQTTGALSGGAMFTQQESIPPATRWQAFWGTLPFLAYGVASMIDKADPIFGLRVNNAGVVVIALALTGLLIGWIRGFPLWSYSYLGWSLVLAWSNANVHVNGVNQGYRVWIPLGIAVLIALLWTRSLRPLGKLFRDIWLDWSRLLLATYALGAWMGMLYDENHHPYLLVFVLAATLVAGCAAWFFLRSSTVRGRILAVAGGVVIAMIISTINSATWDWYAYHGIVKEPTSWYREVWQLAMILSFWGIALFWPAIVELIRRKTARRAG